MVCDSDSMESLVVTAAIIKKEDKFLISQRKVGSHQELMWEFPGGKVEAGEHPENCLRREIYEELNLSVEVNDIYTVVSYNYGKRHVILLCYTCSIVKGQPEKIDCNDFKWVTISEMGEYQFASADIPVVNKLRSYYPRPM